MNEYTKNKLIKGIEYSYAENGEVEILISPGYGAGWSTWNYNYSINLAVDKRIIDFFKENKKEESLGIVSDFLESIGYNHVYCGGWYKLVIETIPVDCKFRISEYDGSESLITYAKDEVWEL